MARFIVAVSGASGIILAAHALTALAEGGHEIELVMTPHALYTAALEMGKKYGTARTFLTHLPPSTQKRVKLHNINDIGSTIASGTYKVDGMLLIPCSMATLAAIAVGLADNLLRRAADVTLKERRKLVIVPRESPLGAIHLENMLKLTQRGATIVPPIPAWYLSPQSLTDIELFIVGKALDALNLPHTLYKPWSGTCG